MKKNVNIALIWFSIVTISALPFFAFDMDFPTAFLEASSALTSIGITSIDAQNSLYFYRAFLAFLGGLLFLLTLPYLISTSDSFKFAIHENFPTKKAIYLYFAYSLLGIFLYSFFGENFKNSIIYSFLTVSATGGIILEKELIIPASILMFLSVILPIFYAVFTFKISLKTILKREQLQLFFIIFFIALFLLLLHKIPLNETIFYILSFMSTTGFVTEDLFDIPNNPIFNLYMLALVGGFIGSVGGGVKLFRVIILFKVIFAELKHILHPRIISVIKLNDRPAPQKIIGKVLSYFFLYTSGIFAFSLIISLFKIPYEEAAAISFSLFTTLGVLPLELKESIFSFNPFLKLIMAFIFIVARLKIFILLIIIQNFYGKIRTSGVHSWKKR